MSDRDPPAPERVPPLQDLDFERLQEEISRCLAAKRRQEVVAGRRTPLPRAAVTYPKDPLEREEANPSAETGPGGGGEGPTGTR